MGLAELEFFVPVSWTVLMTLVISPQLRRNTVVFLIFNGRMHSLLYYCHGCRVYHQSRMLIPCWPQTPSWWLLLLMVFIYDVLVCCWMIHFLGLHVWRLYDFFFFIPIAFLSLLSLPFLWEYIFYLNLTNWSWVIAILEVSSLSFPISFFVCFIRIWIIFRIVAIVKFILIIPKILINILSFNFIRQRVCL